MQSGKKQQKAVQAAERTSMDPAVLASGFSVLLSWYYFFAKGDKMRGLFVGLWAPTIFGFASYFKQSRMGTMVEHAVGREGFSSKVQRIVEEVQNQ